MRHAWAVLHVVAMALASVYLVFGLTLPLVMAMLSLVDLVLFFMRAR